MDAETLYLFRQAAGSLTDAARGELHAMALDVLERRAGGHPPDSWAIELADHALGAMQAPGSDARALLKRELTYLRQAAEFAARQWDNATAAELRRRIANHADAAPQERLQALLAAVETLMRSGGPRRCAPLLDQALEVARQMEDTLSTGDVLAAKAHHAIVMGKPDIGERLAHEALKHGEQADNPALRARALICIASVAMSRGDLAGCDTHASQALELLPDGPGRTRALFYLGDARWQQGRLKETIALFKQALEVATATGNRAAEATALDRLGAVLLNHGDADDGRAHLQRAAEVYAQIGDSVGYGSAISNLAGTLESDDKLDEAHTLRVRALANFKTVGTVYLEGIAYGNLGAVQKKLGRLEAATFSLQRATDLLRRAGRPVEQAVFEAVFGQLLLLLGFIEAAATQAGQAGDVLDKLDAAHWRAQYVTPLEVRIELARGTREADRRARDRLIALRRQADGTPAGSGVAQALELVESLVAQAEQSQPLLFRGHLVSELSPLLRAALLDRMAQIEPDDLAALRRQPWLHQALADGTEGITVPKWDAPESA